MDNENSIANSRHDSTVDSSADSSADSKTEQEHENGVGSDDDDDDDDNAFDDMPLMIDVNAFGIWVSWFDAEEVEYSQSSEKFPPHVLVFRSAIADFLQREPLGRGVRAIDFGTAVYIEVVDGEQTTDLFTWVRNLRSFLKDGDWNTFAVVAHGGSWLTCEMDDYPKQVGDVTILANFGPSDPYRKVVAAEMMSHDDDDGEEGWGVGLFVDVDALDALGRKLKNAPTVLYAGDGQFYRVGG